MKKRIMAMLCAMMMLVTMLSGCGKKETPKEVLTKAFEKSYEMKTAKQSIDMSVNFDLSAAPDDEAKMMLEMFNGARISGTMESDTEAMKSMGNLTAEFSGMSYDMEIYTDGYKSIMKMPMFPQYIVSNAELEGSEEIDQEEIKKFAKEITDSMLASIKDDSISMEEKQTVSINGKDTKVTKITFSFKNEEMKTLMEKIISEMLENEYFVNNLLKENVKTQMEIAGEEFSEEVYKQKLEEMKTEMKTAFDEMEKVVSFDSLDIVYGIDSDYNAVYSDMKFAVTMKMEDEGMTLPFEVKAQSAVWDINKPVDIVLPELNEENSVNLEDMMNPYGVEDEVMMDEEVQY